MEFRRRLGYDRLPLPGLLRQAREGSLRPHGGGAGGTAPECASGARRMGQGWSGLPVHPVPVLPGRRDHPDVLIGRPDGDLRARLRAPRGAHRPGAPGASRRLATAPAPARGGPTRHLRFDDLARPARAGRPPRPERQPRHPGPPPRRKASGGGWSCSSSSRPPTCSRARPPDGSPWPSVEAHPRRDVDRLRGLGAEVVRVAGEGFYEVRFDREEAGLPRRWIGSAGSRFHPTSGERRAPPTGSATRPSSRVTRERGRADRGPPLHPGDAGPLESRGVARATVTLHVGPGTFLPVRTARLEDHRMPRRTVRGAGGDAQAL